MRKEYIFIFILMFLCIFTGCNNEDIDKLNKEIEELKNSNQLKEDEIEELINSNNSKDKEIEDLKNNNQLKEEEIDSLLNSNNSKDKELEDIKKENEEKDKLISKLEEEFKKIQEDNELKEEELNSLLNIKELDDECLNILYKMFDEGVELDEYLSFKENNIKLQEDEELKEKFDDIYYNYNKINSMAYFKNLLQADGLVMTEDVYTWYGYQVVINVTKDLNKVFKVKPDGISSEALAGNYRFYFFDSNEEMEVYLSKYGMIAGNDKINNQILKGNNFYVTASFTTVSIFDQELVKRGFYSGLINFVGELIENNQYISGIDFASKALELQNKNEYGYEIITNAGDDLKNKVYVIGDENKFIMYAYYLKEENDYYNSVWGVEARPSWADDEYIKNYYEKTFFFGRIGFYIPINTYDEKVELLKDTYFYSYILENATNGLDVYLNEKNE